MLPPAPTDDRLSHYVDQFSGPATGIAPGLDVVAATGPLEIVQSQARHPWDALRSAYDGLGFDEATGGDQVSRGRC
jgi:hypothetical protein